MSRIIFGVDVCEDDFVTGFNYAVYLENVSFCEQFRIRNYNTMKFPNSCVFFNLSKISDKIPYKTYGDSSFDEEECYATFAKIKQNISLCNLECSWDCFKVIKQYKEKNSSVCNELIDQKCIDYCSESINW